MSTIGIIGMGFVGKTMWRELTGTPWATRELQLPRSSTPLGEQVYAYDLGGVAPKYDDRLLDVAFICVPTPMGEDGQCDVSAVRLAFEELRDRAGLIVVRSTVPPRTCCTLGEHVVFQPEYAGETPDHPMPRVFVFGGMHHWRNEAADFWARRVRSENFRPVLCTWEEAELAKYMENCFYAVKVTLTQEFRRIAESLGCEWHTVRQAWLADPRIGADHAQACPGGSGLGGKLGFDGKCLPKDVAALVHTLKDARPSMAPLLEAVDEVNRLGRPELYRASDGAR